MRKCGISFVHQCILALDTPLHSCIGALRHAAFLYWCILAFRYWSLEAPAKKDRTDGEPRAYRGEQHEITVLEPARADRIVQSQRDGRRRRVAEPLDVDDDPLRAHAESLGRGLDDAAVGLMRDEEVEVGGRQAVAVEQTTGDLLRFADRELEDRLPGLRHV